MVSEFKGQQPQMAKAVFTLGAPAQNGAVFRTLGNQSEDMFTFNNRVHAHYCEIVRKVPGNQNKTCAHKDPVHSLVPECKVSTMYSEKNKAWRGVSTLYSGEYKVFGKKCVHIGSHLRTVSGHQVRALSSFKGLFSHLRE